MSQGEAEYTLPLRAAAPGITGVHHVALTVSDLETSVAFYTALFGTGPAARMSDGSFRRQVFVLPGGTNLGVTQHDGGDETPFDARTPGLDHLGLQVASRADVDHWIAHLDGLGIHHSGAVDADYGVAVSFVDPDGIALEIFTPSTT